VGHGVLATQLEHPLLVPLRVSAVETDGLQPLRERLTATPAREAPTLKTLIAMSVEYGTVSYDSLLVLKDLRRDPFTLRAHRYLVPMLHVQEDTAILLKGVSCYDEFWKPQQFGQVYEVHAASLAAIVSAMKCFIPCDAHGVLRALTLLPKAQPLSNPTPLTTPDTREP